MCNQIQWLLVKLSVGCGIAITELELKANEYQRQDDCVFTGKGGKQREGAYESEKLASDAVDRWWQ